MSGVNQTYYKLYWRKKLQIEYDSEIIDTTLTT